MISSPHIPSCPVYASALRDLNTWNLETILYHPYISTWQAESVCGNLPHHLRDLAVSGNMEAVQKEHDRLLKRVKASQGIKNVQSTIDLLQSARDAIAAG